MIAYDKQLHLIAGINITFLCGLSLTPFQGLVLAYVAGALKELIYDKAMKKGTPDMGDFLFTGLGGNIGYLLLILTMI